MKKTCNCFMPLLFRKSDRVKIKMVGGAPTDTADRAAGFKGLQQEDGVQKELLSGPVTLYQEGELSGPLFSQLPLISGAVALSSNLIRMRTDSGAFAIWARAAGVCCIVWGEGAPLLSQEQFDKKYHGAAGYGHLEQACAAPGQSDPRRQSQSTGERRLSSV